MSKNVTLWDGTVVTVDDDTAAKLTAAQTGHEQTANQAAAAGATRSLEEGMDASDKARAFVEGGLDTITGGAYGKVMTELSSDEDRFAFQRSAQGAPGYRLGGEVAGFFVPTGLPALAGRLGQAGMVGRLAEGAIQGVGGYISQTNVHGDPLSIEGLAEGAGIGGVLNIGAGMLSDRLFRSAKKAQSAIDEAENLAKSEEIVKANAKHFETDAGVNTAYKQFATGVKVREKAAAQNLKAWQKTKAEYDDFINDDHAFGEAITDAQNVVRTVRSRYASAEMSGIRDGVEATAKKAEDLTGKFDVSDSPVEEMIAVPSPGNSKQTTQMKVERWTRDRFDPTMEVPWVKYPHGEEPILEAVRKVREPVTEAAPQAAKQTGHRVEFIEGKWRTSGPVGPDDATRLSSESLPPISQELHDRLRGYEQRISDLWRMRGGKNKLGTKTWMKDPTIPKDREGAMHELRRLYADLLDGQTGFPQAASKMKLATKLPLPPGEAPTLLTKVGLPANFKAFTRMTPESIATLARQMDDVTAAEFNKVAQELGILPLERGADTMLAVHGQAKGWMKAIDDLEAAAESGSKAVAKGKGFNELARRFIRGQLRFKAGVGAAKLVGGGALGVGAGALASGVVGAGLLHAEDALIGGSLLSAKTAIKDKIRSVVAEYGGPVAKGVRALGPITAYLSSSALTNEADPEPSLRKQARNRIDEIHAAAAHAPDTAFAAVAPLMGHISDAALKMHQHVVGALQYLSAMAPKDPGLNTKLFESKWTPHWNESIGFAHRVEAVFNPTAALARQLNGTGHPDGAQTLWDRWPAFMQQAAQDIIEKTSQEKYSMQRASAFSRLFRTPLTGFQDPVIATALQGMYMESQAAPQGGQSAQPTGRPAKVQSPVAGSNVSQLIA